MTAKPTKRYFFKILTILPLTFLFTPLFYTFLGYHPDSPWFPWFVYLYHAIFIFFGAALAAVFKKYKYLAYPVIFGVAFLCKNIISLSVFNFQQAVIVIDEFGEEFFINIPLEPENIMYYTYILMLTASISGFIGVFYSKKSAFDMVSRNSTFFYFYSLVIISGFYFFSGIMEIDKSSGNIFAVYLTGFVVSYFIVYNYALINREISVYAERGVYNTSGLNRIYGYYFSALTLTAVIPVFIAVFLVPFIVNILEVVINFIVAFFLWLISLSKASSKKPPDPDLPAAPVNPIYAEKSPDSNLMIICILILAGIFLITVIIFGKQIKEFILSLFAKMNPQDSKNNKIINQEIITEVKREKKSKPSYKDYLKKSKRIMGLRERFLFAYNYIFWTVIKKDEKLKSSATPYEVAEIYEETLSPAGLYQDIKYGKKFAETNDPEFWKIKINEAENFLYNFLK